MGKRGRENKEKVKELTEVVEGSRELIWNSFEKVKINKARLESNLKDADKQVSDESSSESGTSGSGEGSPRREPSSP